MPGGKYPTALGTLGTNDLPYSVFANTLLAALVHFIRHATLTDFSVIYARLNVRGRLCADVEHQQAPKMVDNLIDNRPTRVRASRWPPWVMSLIHCTSHPS